MQASERNKLRTLAVRFLKALRLWRAWDPEGRGPGLPVTPEVLVVSDDVVKQYRLMRARMSVALDRLGEPLRLRSRRSLVVIWVDVDRGLIVERFPRVCRPERGDAACR